MGGETKPRQSRIEPNISDVDSRENGAHYVCLIGQLSAKIEHLQFAKSEVETSLYVALAENKTLTLTSKSLKEKITELTDPSISTAQSGSLARNASLGAECADKSGPDCNHGIDQSSSSEEEPSSIQEPPKQEIQQPGENSNLANDRTEVLALQRENEEIRKELQEMKSKYEEEIKILRQHLEDANEAFTRAMVEKEQMKSENDWFRKATPDMKGHRHGQWIAEKEKQEKNLQKQNNKAREAIQARDVIIQQLKVRLSQENKRENVEPYKQHIEQIQTELQRAKAELKQAKQSQCKEEARYQKIQEGMKKKLSDMQAWHQNAVANLNKQLEETNAAYTKEMLDKENLAEEVDRLKRRVQVMMQGNTAKKPSPAGQEDQECSQELQELKEALRKAKELINARDATVKELTTRLSAEMSVKISGDEKCLENICIKNRPMNVATEYENLCSNEWLEAKSTLDHQLPDATESVKCAVLSRVLFICQQKGVESMQTFYRSLARLFSSPLDVSENIPVTTPLADALRNITGDVLRGASDNTDVSSISKATKRLLLQEFPGLPEHLFGSPSIQKYIEACSRLSWKMALQRPPMEFRTDGIGEPWKGPNQQEVYFKSSDPEHPNSRVEFYVHPTLMHGDSLMVKGRVFHSCA